MVIVAIGTALTANSKTASTTPPTAASPNAAAPSAAPAATTAPATDNTAQAVADWWNGGGKSDLQAVTAALDAAGADGTAGNLSAMAQDCGRLSTAIANLQAIGPMPYHPAEKWLAKALALWSESAAQCQAGASSDNAESLEQATIEMNKGNNDLGRATSAIDRLSGS
jgi:hypothetical protein